MKRLSLWTKLFLGLVLFSLAGTLLTRFTSLDPGPIRPVASLLTIAIGFIALARLAKPSQAVAVVLLGGATEICGIYTGFPFGTYRYTDHWWPTIDLPQGHHFPLLLPFAWFLIAGGCAIALRPLGKSMLVLAPLLATLIDFFMEPVMTQKLGYWVWSARGPLPGEAPWLNMVGWFATSLIAAIVLRKGKSSDEAVWILTAYVFLIAGLWAVG